MIKSLKKYQVMLTPFDATKNWALNNTDNDNLWLTEDDYPVALQFIDYGDGSGLPFENSLCNIALEQQGTDLATIEDGLNVTGPFFPETEPANVDGTYKRSIFHQVRTMFYNTYLDPTKIWGTENIDFELSKTQRLLTDQFRLFDIPRVVFGDKMTPNTVVMSDNTLDNPYTVTDDGNGNMFAGTNLFSHQQELGEHDNEFIASLSSSLCDWYWFNDSTALTDTASLAMAFFGGAQENVLRTDTMSLAMAFLFGSNVDYPQIDAGSITMNLFGGSIAENVLPVYLTGSSSDTSTNTMEFFSGVNTDTTQVVTASFESASIDMSFLSGSNADTTFVVTASFESSSITMNFVTGSNQFTTYVVTASFESMSLAMNFYGGSNANI